MLNIWNLTSGSTIRIVKTFRDRIGREFKAGRVLHYTHRDYLPYHSGHTVHFREDSMSLCDDDQTGAIVENRGNEFYEAADPEA